MFGRIITDPLRAKLRAPYVHILFGARQTGKSTLLEALVPDAAIRIDLSDPGQRSEYLRRPETLVAQCRALPRRRGPAWVVVDEAQAVPALFDAVQHLYDSDKRRWRFVLCGSSARKLRVTGANLLPGRALVHRLYPLVLPERRPVDAAARHEDDGSLAANAHWRLLVDPFPATDLMDRLVFGDLPGVAVAKPGHRADLLKSYCAVYLEEELRREALIKDWGAFSRFLELAALEAGTMTNFASISREAGVSLPTVQSYYQLLEDMFVGFRIPGYSGSGRKGALSTPRFYLFDLGIRHAAARLEVTAATVRANPGPIFEQWVAIELWKRIQYLGRGRLSYLRTKAGSEIDIILQLGRQLVPIEVKWTEHPSRTDARHLIRFLDEHRHAAKKAFIVCRLAKRMQLADRVLAIPWQEL